MGNIIILEETTKNPITLIGKRAGVCQGADITDDIKNYNRGIDCITSNHGRTLEYVNVEMIIDGYSARVIREWYTHIGGAPTRLQASTRYIDYEHGFNYIVPESVRNNEKRYDIYLEAIHQINKALVELENLDTPREDTALLLPLGMTTKIVDKRNLRNLIDMSHQRMCNRAYHEYRSLFSDICSELSKISDEWKWIVDNLLEPKCNYLGYCPEKNSCGKIHRRVE
ncbi:MAG: FAD-dependent thymidylate synthase [Ruminococcus flavefaciens]|nr:FAD-dependent thymidylate synthase [Ruminococcus flavefaciens]